MVWTTTPLCPHPPRLGPTLSTTRSRIPAPSNPAQSSHTPTCGRCPWPSSRTLEEEPVPWPMDASMMKTFPPSRRSSPKIFSITTPRPRHPSLSSSTLLGSSADLTDKRDSSSSLIQSWLFPMSTLSPVRSWSTGPRILNLCRPLKTHQLWAAISVIGRLIVANRSTLVSSSIVESSVSGPRARGSVLTVILGSKTLTEIKYLTSKDFETQEDSFRK